MLVFAGVHDGLIHLDAGCLNIFRQQVTVLPVWAGIIAVQNRDQRACPDCCTGD